MDKDNAQFESRISKIEDKLENPKKSAGDIVFQLLSSLLLPAAIAFAGLKVSQAQTAVQTHSAEQIADKEQAIALINAQVGQAQVVAAFLRSLLSENDQEKQLAIAAVIIALPAEGPQLVRIISKSDASPTVREFADASLKTRQADLIAGLYSSDRDSSLNAADHLAKGWHADPDLTTKLLQAAQGDESNTNAIRNTLRLLQQVDEAQLRRHKTEVEQFIRKVRTITPAIKAQAESLKKKL